MKKGLACSLALPGAQKFSLHADVVVRISLP
jgi:hypothetical protein